MITSNHHLSVLLQTRIQFVSLRTNGIGDLIEKPMPPVGQVTTQSHSPRCVHLQFDHARLLELLQYTSNDMSTSGTSTVGVGAPVPRATESLCEMIDSNGTLRADFSQNSCGADLPPIRMFRGALPVDSSLHVVSPFRPTHSLFSCQTLGERGYEQVGGNVMERGHMDTERRWRPTLRI